jgi:hypothetical protein
MEYYQQTHSEPLTLAINVPDVGYTSLSRGLPLVMQLMARVYGFVTRILSYRDDVASIGSTFVLVIPHDRKPTCRAEGPSR